MSRIAWPPTVRSPVPFLVLLTPAPGGLEIGPGRAMGLFEDPVGQIGKAVVMVAR